VRKLTPYLVVLSMVFVLFSLAKVSLLKNEETVCANSISCVKNLSVNVENSAEGLFNGKAVTPPKIDLTADSSKQTVLGDSTVTGDKHIYVDLATQTLTAYQGNTVFMKTLISSGKWNKTPTGDFKIWIRLRATRMTGGSGADYYNLPNVPFVMFFANASVSQGAGFSLHGTYWHNNFGHPMSHGCVNMRTVDAEKIFNWIDDPQVNGTPITIYGQAPL